MREESQPPVHPGHNSQEAKLLEIIKKLAEELRSGARLTQPMHLDSSLDRDLGLNSLARMELLVRLEQAFGVSLSEQELATVESPRDILRALEKAATATPQTVTTNRPKSISEPQEQKDFLPLDAKTLPAVLAEHARHQPDRVHILFEPKPEERTSLTYDQLQRGAMELAAGLQRHNLDPGETVAIMLPTGIDYFLTFFAVLLAGAIPVPLYPPARPSQIEEHLRRHRGILRNAGARILITVPEVKLIGALLKTQVDSLMLVETVDTFRDQAQACTPIPTRAKDIAFIQYTSGSTGDPKGVALTHANLLANIRAMGQATEVTSADIFVSWLPLYHDMGLIGAWLGSLYHGCRLVIIPPLSFLARPERWLRAIHTHGGTLSASPNFGYDLCSRRLGDATLTGMDLSSWRLAFNGAEPVSPETLAAFARRFAPYGFDPKAATPVYGLAECSVGLTFPPLHRGPMIDRVRRTALAEEGVAEPATTDAGSLQFVSCGRPLPGHQIRIVDEAGREVPDRHQGHLQFKGPSATSGYYRNPEKTRTLFQGDWLDTGDLAYSVLGEVYITGRVKDVIIQGGRNIYPHELEEAVGNIADIRRGCVVVFASPDPQTGTERLIVVAESRKREERDLQKLRTAIINLAVDLLAMPPDEVVIAPPGSVLKTSSGKIRRAACRHLFEQGSIGKPGPSLQLQLVRLALAGIVPQLRRMARRTKEWLYAAYCWSLFFLLGLPLWLLVILLPSAERRWQVVRRGLRLLLALSRTKVTVQGMEHFVPQTPCILVANHSSYLDSLLLAAVLPLPVRFVAKAELARQFFARTLLTRLHVLWVERFDAVKGAEDAHRITGIAKAGERPLFFAEGTLQRMTGLLPFQMGAFAAAAQADIPILPVTIRGTRNKLRGDSWFPRRGPVSVQLSKPISPTGTGWQETIRLRDQVREEILRNCGEPDLAGEFTSLAQLDLQRPEPNTD